MKLFCLIALAVIVAGCGMSQFSGSTSASMTLPTGEQITWESNKDVGGLDASYDPVTKAFHIKVDKSSTSEAAITATAQSMAQTQAALAGLLNQLAPLLKAGAAAATIP